MTLHRRNTIQNQMAGYIFTGVVNNWLKRWVLCSIIETPFSELIVNISGILIEISCFAAHFMTDQINSIRLSVDKNCLLLKISYMKLLASSWVNDPRWTLNREKPLDPITGISLLKLTKAPCSTLPCDQEINRLKLVSAIYKIGVSTLDAFKCFWT